MYFISFAQTSMQGTMRVEHVWTTALPTGSDSMRAIHNGYPRIDKVTNNMFPQIVYTEGVFH